MSEWLAVVCMFWCWIAGVWLGYTLAFRKYVLLAPESKPDTEGGR